MASVSPALYGMPREVSPRISLVWLVVNNVRKHANPSAGMRNPITAAMTRFSRVSFSHPHCHSTCVPDGSKIGQSTTMNTMITARIFHTQPMRFSGTPSVMSMRCSMIRTSSMNAQLRHTRHNTNMTTVMRNFTRGSARCSQPSPGTYKSASISVVLPHAW